MCVMCSPGPRKIMKNEKNLFQNLETELQTYQSCGISLLLEGRESSPESIAAACMVAERGTYMRDYIQDQNGKIERIYFNFVSESV